MNLQKILDPSSPNKSEYSLYQRPIQTKIYHSTWGIFYCMHNLNNTGLAERGVPGVQVHPLFFVDFIDFNLKIVICKVDFKVSLLCFSEFNVAAPLFLRASYGSDYGNCNFTCDIFKLEWKNNRLLHQKNKSSLKKIIWYFRLPLKVCTFCLYERMINSGLVWFRLWKFCLQSQMWDVTTNTFFLRNQYT